MPLFGTIARLHRRENLSADEMTASFPLLFDPGVAESEKREFLVSLYEKGETAAELAAAARFLRGRAVKFAADADELVDCCGTGGDRKGTLNISTAVAFVLAGGGCRVAKHGNRAVSSRSGSSDVLNALGVNADLGPEEAIDRLERTGLLFLSAPRYHPLLKDVAALRRAIPHRTVFNLLGPLMNPMGARRQILGVYDPKFVPVMTETLRELGSVSAVVVSSKDGLDEFSLTDTALAALLRDGRIETFEFDPWKATGYPRCQLRDLAGGTPEENAARLKKTLKGHSMPADHVVHINAAWGFVAAGKTDSFMEGLIIAQEAIASGRAFAKLEEAVGGAAS